MILESRLDVLFPTMDPRHSAQDVVWCTLCKDAVGPMYCEVCLVHLSDECAEKHLFDTSNAHKVVPLTQFLSFNYPKCPDHPNKGCDITSCKSWISPENHSGNNAVDNFEDLESLFIESEEQGNIHPSHLPYRPLLDVPRLIIYPPKDIHIYTMCPIWVIRKSGHVVRTKPWSCTTWREH